MQNKGLQMDFLLTDSVTTLPFVEFSSHFALHLLCILSPWCYSFKAYSVNPHVLRFCYSVWGQRLTVGTHTRHLARLCICTAILGRLRCHRLIHVKLDMYLPLNINMAPVGTVLTVIILLSSTSAGSAENLYCHWKKQETEKSNTHTHTK